MTEREQDTEHAKQEAAEGGRGEEQEPKQAGEGSLFDTSQHSDSPGPFGTGDEQTETEAAGNPEADNSEDDADDDAA